MIRFLPVLLAAPSFAATISYTASVPGAFSGTPTNATTQTTTWNQSATLNQFDPSLGTLTKVTLSLVGGVFGSVRLESQDASPATINYALSASVTATGVGGLNVVVLPAASGTFNASSDDGVLDFGGTSGSTFSNLSNASSSFSSSSAPLVLSAYTGLSTFLVNLAALGNSSANGSGNLVTSFTTKAGALVTVSYDYDEPVTAPEPATFAFVGAALVAAGVLRRSR